MQWVYGSIDMKEDNTEVDEGEMDFDADEFSVPGPSFFKEIRHDRNINRDCVCD